MKCKITLFIFFITAVASFAQVPESKSDKKMVLKRAESLYDSLQFEAALPLYLQLIQADTANATYNIAAGICYLNSGKDKIKAIPYLERVIRKNKGELGKEAMYHLGQAYHLAGRFDDAINVYEKYQAGLKKNDERQPKITRKIEMCITARELEKKPVPVNIINLSAFINSPFPEYSPLISGDDSTMILTSRRPGSTGGLKEDNGLYYEDIYISKKINDTIWSSPVSIDPNINSPDHDACVGLSADGQELIVYKDDEGDGNLYASFLNGNSWTKPVKLNSNINTFAFEPSASISPDGNTIYFVSDRKGGLGGKDIYKSVKMADGEWGPAINLGPKINTIYDEDGPFIHADNHTFFFSSTGHNSMGGYDIFRSDYNATTDSWSDPVNVGYPINTVDDDIYFVLAANGRHAYYSSLRESGVGEKDIYLINFEPPLLQDVAQVKGVLVPTMLDLKKTPVILTVKEKGSEKIVSQARPNIQTGKYNLFLKPGLTYEITASAEGYPSAKERFELKNLGKYYELYQTFNYKGEKSQVLMVMADSVKKAEKKQIDADEEFNRLIAESKKLASDSSFKKQAEQKPSEDVPVSTAKPSFNKVAKKAAKQDIISFKTIFFDSNAPTIRDEAKAELDAVVKTLLENPALNVEVGGHADNQGKEKSNMILSKKRAQMVAEYLKSKGILSSRITIKAYGESQPFASNNTEEGRQSNRRVELTFSNR